MRSWMITLAVSLSLATAPAILRAAPHQSAATSRTSDRTDRPARRPVDADARARYADREKDAKPLEDFEGGRITEVTLIVILLIVIIIVILI